MHNVAISIFLIALTQTNQSILRDGKVVKKCGDKANCDESDKEMNGMRRGGPKDSEMPTIAPQQSQPPPKDQNPQGKGTTSNPARPSRTDMVITQNTMAGTTSSGSGGGENCCIDCIGCCCGACCMRRMVAKMKGALASTKERLLAKAEANENLTSRPLGRGKFWEQPHRGQLKQTVEKFNSKADETKKELESNPFSDTYVKPQHNLDDERYGRPKQGSLTEKRGISAGNSISKEIVELCRVISDHGKKSQDGTTVITFGEMFDIYVNISNKVVGMLMRARKHGLVRFEGEMLFQRRDERVPITLLKSIEDITAQFSSSGDPARCLRSDTH